MLNPTNVQMRVLNQDIIYCKLLNQFISASYLKESCLFISLTACDKVCSGCTGAGPDKCQACASGYEDTEGTCTGMM